MKLAAVASSVFCVLAALWIYNEKTLDTALAGGAALYFLAKACFLGPLLWMKAEERERERGEVASAPTRPAERESA